MSHCSHGAAAYGHASRTLRCCLAAIVLQVTCHLPPSAAVFGDNVLLFARFGMARSFHLLPRVIIACVVPYWVSNCFAGGSVNTNGNK